MHRDAARSMMAAKSFRPLVHSIEKMEHWIHILGSELYARVTDNFELSHQWPKTLMVSIILIKQNNITNVEFCTIYTSTDTL